MNLVLTGLRLFVFYLCEFGWMCLVRRRLHVPLSFCPMVSVAANVCVLFLAGLLNVLEPMCYVVYGIGLVSLVVCAYRQHEALRCWAGTGVLWVFAATAVFLVVSANKFLTHYDNFSHWALIVKEMLRTNSYPSFKSELITFQSYPPGSATWVWFFAKLVGDTEPVWMTGQIYSMLVCFAPLVGAGRAGAGEKSDGGLAAWGRLLFAVTATSLLALVIAFFNTSPFDLLVDTQLPVVAGGTTILAASTAWRGPHAREGALAVGMMAVFIVLIKNSGVLFLVPIMVVAWCCGARLSGTLVALGLPVVSLVLWNAHCSYVFMAASTTKHAMTLDSLTLHAEDKTPEDIDKITQMVIEASLQGSSLYATVAFVALSGFVAKICPVRQKTAWSLCAVGCLIFLLMYIVGMLLMYVYSMPLGEALELAEFGRYRRTVFVFIVFVFGYLMMQYAGHGRVAKCMVLASFALALLVTRTLLYESRRSPYDRMRLEAALGNVPSERSYVVCVESDTSGYYRYLTRYETWSNRVQVLQAVSPEDVDRTMQAGYEWVINLDTDNTALAEWIAAECVSPNGTEAATFPDE